MLIVGSAGYVGGFVFHAMKTKGLSGKAALPHPEFWGSVHGLVSDGVTFTQRRVVEMRGGSGSADAYLPRRSHLRKILHNFPLVLALMFAIFYLSRYSPVKDAKIGKGDADAGAAKKEPVDPDSPLRSAGEEAKQLFGGDGGSDDDGLVE